MKTWNKDQLISNLKKEGLSFSEFSLIHEGNYTTDDADWNYKDVPHLKHVHELVDATFAAMQDDLITTINVQKVLGIKLPLSVVNYQSGKNEQTYYTTWLFYILIVQTHFEKIETCRTRVITTYHIGYPWLLKWSVPLIRFLIKRNYENLMTSDIPMRERRGQLRKWGYTFYKDSDSYSFPKTMEILKTNVIAPNITTLPLTLSLTDLLPQDGEYFYGRDDHIGLRLVRVNNQLHIFARTCMHEGASLDTSPCVNLKVKCPWHGRLHTPLASFNLANHHPQQKTQDQFTFTLTNNVLTISEASLEKC